MPPKSLLVASAQAMAASKRKAPAGGRRKMTLAQEEASKRPEDIARVVNRNILRMFGNAIPPAAVGVVQVNGVTMCRKMIQDRTALLAAGKVRADPEYFGDIKRMYMAALSGQTLAVPANPSRELHDGLAEAIAVARARQRRDRKKEPLIHWLRQRRTKLNQKSVVKIVDLLVELQVAGCPKFGGLVVQVFSAFERLKMLEDYKKELGVAMPGLEEGLKSLFAEESRKDTEYDVSIFWNKYRTTAGTFLDPAMVDSVLSEEDSWENVTSQLSALSTGSKLGAELFLDFCPEVVAAHACGYMKDQAAVFAASDKPVNPDALGELSDGMLAEASRLKIDKMVTVGKDYEIPFMDSVATLKCDTSVDLAHRHVQAMVKTLAVKHGKLDLMSIEQEIRGQQAIVQTTREFAESVLKPFRDARKEMYRVSKTAVFNEPGDVPDFMESKRGLWENTDETFDLEVAYMRKLAGTEGGAFLVTQAIDELPDGTKVLKFGDCLLKLRALTGTRAWQFASPTSQGVVNSLVAMIAKMERGEGPCAAEFPANTPMGQAGQRVANFCAAKKSEEVDGVATETQVYGMEALTLRINEAKKAVDEKTLKDLGPVTACQVYRWLLSSEKAQELDVISRKAYELVTKGAAAASQGEKKAGAAVEHMVAAHTSAKAAKALKKAAAKPAPAKPAKKKAKKS
ncbi:unnamed protein product [Prorocentrum cordatum]|uniref:Uncharacterized protein n=1 Tax=Prorocentrum cordatum TaxID=2364126 RepID=A0ABN9QL31_9DINO|nr:unnamed protein product [Polarella glacialis]